MRGKANVFLALTSVVVPVSIAPGIRIGCWPA